MRELSIQI
jgi:hypothetical protein